MIELELIKAHVLGKNRGWLLTHPNHVLSASQQKQYDILAQRYKAGEPLPYILGYKEFYGRTFEVCTHTLIPRPESELIVDEAKKIAASMSAPIIVDVGTGSGCLGITAALEIPHATVHAIDISQDALKTARNNAQKLNAHVTFHQGNLLQPITTWHHETMVCANLPYIPTQEWNTLNHRVKNHEPRIALDGGVDGLDVYRKLLQQLPHKRIHLLCETMPEQTATLSREIKKVRPHAQTTIIKDLSEYNRIVYAHVIS